MKFTIERQDEYSVFSLLEPRLDFTLSAELKSELIEIIAVQGINHLIIDLTNVTFMDSSCISAFLVANRNCNETDGIMVLTNLGAQVKKIIQVAQLNTVFNITEAIPEARKIIMAHVLENTIFGDDEIDDEDPEFDANQETDDSDE